MFWATRRAGLRITAINWHLTGEEAAYIVDDCDAKAFFADARFADAAGARRAARCQRAAADRHRRFAFPASTTTNRGCRTKTAATFADPQLGSPDAVHVGHDRAAERRVSVGPAADRRRIRPSRPSYRPGAERAPVHRAAVSRGAAVVLARDPARLRRGRRDDGRLGRRARPAADRAASASRTRTWCRRCFIGCCRCRRAARRHDLSSLRYILHGAAPCPVASSTPDRVARADRVRVLRRNRRHRHVRGFARRGCSSPARSASRTATITSASSTKRAGELPPRRARPDLPARAGAGALHVLQGRHRRRASAYRGDYYTLGDIGYLDDDGYLFLTDRSAHLIISGGVNIYPAEVEAVLLTHPAIADVGVIGVAESRMGRGSEGRGDAAVRLTRRRTIAGAS